MVKDTRDKVIALGVIGAMNGSTVALVLKLIGSALSLVEIPVNFVLSLIGLEVVLAYLVLGLIGSIIISRREKSSLIKSPFIVICGMILIGYVAGFVLNFISSSPLIMGGMIGFIYPALFILLLVLLSRNPNKENGVFGEILGEILKDSKAFFIKLGIVTVIGTAVGVGLGVAVSAVFPNVMLGMWSIALASAVIGAVVFPIEIFIGNLSAINKLGTFTAKLITPSSKENEPSKSLGEILANLAEENKPMSEILANLAEGKKPMNEVLASLAEGNKPSKSLDEVLVSLAGENESLDKILANLTSSSPAAFSTP